MKRVQEKAIMGIKAVYFSQVLEEIILSEYRYILSLYREYKRYYLKIILCSAALLILASLVVALNFVRISPLFIYAVALAGALVFAHNKRVESKNFDELKEFLAKYQPKILANEEEVFFIDYQLKAYFEQESTTLFDHLNDDVAWNDEKALAHLQAITGEIDDYYHYLNEHDELEENIEISLDVYHQSFEKKKNDLV